MRVDSVFYLKPRTQRGLTSVTFTNMIRHFILVTTIATTAAWALNPGNAGPEKVELKFKLPPPKPLSPAEELKTFKVAPGFHVELFASEPMIECPVSMSWDDQGRLYVLEMRGYMPDVDAKGEDQPTCVISVLEDTDGDGKADKKTVFADGLVLARALMVVNGGALVAEPPLLYFMKDTNGDGKADLKEVVDGVVPRLLALAPSPRSAKGSRR